MASKTVTSKTSRGENKKASGGSMVLSGGCMVLSGGSMVLSGGSMVLSCFRRRRLSCRSCSIRLVPLVSAVEIFCLRSPAKRFSSGVNGLLMREIALLGAINLPAEGPQLERGE